MSEKINLITDLVFLGIATYQALTVHEIIVRFGFIFFVALLATIVDWRCRRIFKRP